METGLFDWRTLDLHLIGDDDAAKHLESGLAAGATRRQILLTIVASGRARLLQRSALEAAVEAIAPEFAQVVLDTDDLVTDCESGDLDRIDRGGALRQAAEALLAESLDERRAAGEREIAREALIRLFSYCEAMQL